MPFECMFSLIEELTELGNIVVVVCSAGGMVSGWTGGVETSDDDTC